MLRNGAWRQLSLYHDFLMTSFKGFKVMTLSSSSLLSSLPQFPSTPPRSLLFLPFHWFDHIIH